MDDMTHGLGAMEGHPEHATVFEQPQHQHADCMEAAVADVIDEVIGAHLTDEQIAQEALHTPSTVPFDPQTGHPHPYVYDPAHGSMLADAPQLLAAHGVPGVYTDDQHASAGGPATGIDALRQQLSAGHHVIVFVDAEKIWGSIGLPGQQDSNTPDHFVEVTGIDPDKGVVYLNDTGNQDPAHPHAGAGEAVKIEVFEKAWQTGRHAMVATTVADHAVVNPDPCAVPGPNLPASPADPFAPHHVETPGALDRVAELAVVGGLGAVAVGALAGREARAAAIANTTAVLNRARRAAATHTDSAVNRACSWIDQRKARPSAEPQAGGGTD